jgi:hypothetical protein
MIVAVCLSLGSHSARAMSQEEIARLAEIVGLKSKHVCPSSLSDILKGSADHLFDRNAICELPAVIHVAIVNHAVIPLLEGM